MKKWAAKMMSGGKRLSTLTDTEREDRAAAMKVTGMYNSIVKKGESKNEIDMLSSVLGKDDDKFDSQEFNECFMNLHGYE